MYANPFKSKFLLNPELSFLNFASFGACPEDVFDEYQRFQRLLEYEPVDFITKSGVQLLKKSRRELSEYISCDEEDLIFVPNPTHAVNIIAKSWKLEAGDEILTTDLEYGAIDKTWKFYAEKYGYNYVQQEIKLPVHSKEEIIEQFWKGLTPKTKAIFISEITSATALILPVKEICKRAKELGLITIVDGAHVPGHIPLNLKTMQADYYTGACHKWMMTPKGSSFLYVSKEKQAELDPLIVSWGYKSAHPGDSPFFDYHQFNGTRDFTAYLTIPASLKFMKENNWNEIAKNCRKMAYDNLPRFTHLLETEALAPNNVQFMGQMCSIPVKTKNTFALHDLLLEKYKIQVPVFDPVTIGTGNQQYIRYSIQAFNTQDDLDKLYDALSELKYDGVLSTEH